MRDRFEVLLAPVVDERLLGERGPIQGAVGVEDVGTEPLDELLQRGRSRLDHLARDQVGVHDGRAACREQRRHRRLPRPDPAREPHHEHPPRLPTPAAVERVGSVRVVRATRNDPTPGSDEVSHPSRTFPSDFPTVDGGEAVHPFERTLIDHDLVQHGVVAVRQLDQHWSAGVIRHRARAHRRLVARGVLANPAVRPTLEQRAMAAVLTGGDSAFASHETAAALWKMPLPNPAMVEMTTARERRVRLRGVRVHRSGLVEASDATVIDGIPIATPELAIYGLSSRYSVRVLGRMTDDALRRHITTPSRLAALVDRLPAAPGRSPLKMRAVLDRRLPGTEERESTLEDFVFAAVTRFGLPPPVPQHEVVYNGQSRRIDLCYPDDRVALEAKGFVWYAERTGFDRDALRGNELQLAGFKVLSFTSAFTDYEIAVQVAEALRLPVPTGAKPRTFREWSAHH
jgi:hypothetical protein